MMFIAAALIGSVVSFWRQHGICNQKNHNEAEQEIEQEQENEQNAQCVSGEFTIAACNNLGFLFQNNEGNLALAQR